MHGHLNVTYWDVEVSSVCIVQLRRCVHVSSPFVLHVSKISSFLIPLFFFFFFGRYNFNLWMFRSCQHMISTHYDPGCSQSNSLFSISSCHFLCHLPIFPLVSFVFILTSVSPYILFFTILSLSSAIRCKWPNQLNRCAFMWFIIFLCLINSSNSLFILILHAPSLSFVGPKVLTLTYLLTPWCRVLLEKPTGLQLVKKFPAFYGTRRFITTFTRARHLSLSWARWIKYMPPIPLTEDPA